MSRDEAPVPEPPPPEELRPALACFEAGDFRGAKRALAALDSNANPEVAAAAATLNARMASDPWVRRVSFAVLAALVLAAWLYVL